MPGAPKISVVLATYKRADVLAKTLQCLVEQDLPASDFEVIVIDDGSPDETAEVVRAAQQTAPFRLTYLHHANRGPGFTQNRGIEAAQAAVVLLMADDIWMALGALRAHAAFHEANPAETHAALGRVEQSPAIKTPEHSVFLRIWDPFRFSRFGGMSEVPYYRFWACNISVKRDFVRRVGGFREQKGLAGPATHEDAELGYRLHPLGLRIFYCPDALGHHYHVFTLKQACERAYQRGFNFADFHAAAPAPEIPVAYHVSPFLQPRDYMRALTGEGRKHLHPVDRNPLLLAMRMSLRMLAFNRLSVPYFWMPLFKRAESDARVARRLTSNMYRGAIHYYFDRGCVDRARSNDAVPNPVPADRIG